MNGGQVIFKFTGDTNELQQKTNSIGDIIKGTVAGLGISKIIDKGISVINDSLDGAISRFDTLNNFPRVMKNLGIDSTDASRSIQKMSDKLAGLPTTLDEGAMAVQRFTSANGDINKSTDYFLALNNAILAGGASTQIQSSALEQLSQAYAKGKPDMMEWRSLLSAMPAQVNQVAQSFNMTSDELGEALRDGSISMNEFMDRIVVLNTEGVNGFASFEEQARNSTDGIGTAITVAKTQVVKGVTDMIDGLNKGLEDADLPGISEIIAGIGKETKKILDKVAENLPTVIKFLKDMKPLIVAIGLGFVAWKVGKTIQTLVTGFQAMKVQLALMKMEMGTTTVAGGLLKMAMAGVNAVMAANPIALVIAAIVALVAGFIYLWNTSEDFRNFWIGLWNGIKKVAEDWWNGFKLMIDSIGKGVKKLIDDVVAWFKSIPQKISDLKDKMLNIGSNLIKGLWNGINDKTQWVLDKIKGFGNSIIKAVKKVFGIHSPSKEFAWVGQMNAEGLIVGMEDMEKEVQQIFDGMFDLSPNLQGNSSLMFNNTPNITVINNMEQDPLGQMINSVKTFSGGAKNDYNYGQGV